MSRADLSAGRLDAELAPFFDAHQRLTELETQHETRRAGTADPARVAAHAGFVDAGEAALPVLSAFQSAWPALDGEAAVRLLDTLQAWSDTAPSTHPSRPRALRVLPRLAGATHHLPRALFVSGVQLSDREPWRLGGFADLYRGTRAGAPVVLKRLRVAGAADGSFYSKLCHEALAWRQLAHAHVLPFLGIDAATFASTGAGAGLLCLVAPYMRRGTLREFVRSIEYDAGRDMLRLLEEAADGLVYLHAQGVVHGDINDSNILIDDAGAVQLADFGLAVISASTRGAVSGTCSGTATGVLGTVRWMAPERLLGAPGARARPADVFAFACLCYYMHAGHAPFQARVETAVCLLVLTGSRPSRPVAAGGAPAAAGGAPAVQAMAEGLWALVGQCWAQEAQERPRMAQVLAAVKALRAPATATIPAVPIPEAVRLFEAAPLPAAAEELAVADAFILQTDGPRGHKRRADGMDENGARRHAARARHRAARNKIGQGREKPGLALLRDATALGPLPSGSRINSGSDSSRPAYDPGAPCAPYAVPEACLAMFAPSDSAAATGHATPLSTRIAARTIEITDTCGAAPLAPIPLISGLTSGLAEERDQDTHGSSAHARDPFDESTLVPPWAHGVLGGSSDAASGEDPRETRYRWFGFRMD